jgi:glutaredoxin
MNFPAPPALLFLGALLVSSVGYAGTLYKSVSQDGTVLYSDQPPADGKVQKTITFTELPATPLPESAIRYRQALQKSMQNRLTAAPKPSGGSAQLFTAQWCGYCRKAKAYLAEKGVGYQEHDIDTAEGRLAFAQAGNATGVPLLLWRDRKVQGFSKAGYDALLGPSP